ncbi:MAG: SIS domain-containing protein [Bacteroidales bacterium]|nr:SIS domain-containing protein [Bacteroidales bacterium]MDD4209048.1 SIS domain-containing protein [Bacteroidales bacterium]
MMNIQQKIKESIELKEKLLSDTLLLKRIADSIDMCVQSLQSGGCIFFCGNGGSAADAQHLAAELSGRFYFDRPPLRTEALHCNTSYLTAVANDYGYNHIFSRLLEGNGKKSDVLIGLSTSGNSESIINAFLSAKNKEIKTIALTGASVGKLKDISDIILNVPSSDTPRIQEAHILIGHILCEYIESAIFSNK